MDIKAKIGEITDKIKNDKNLLANFTKDPVKTIEGLIGIDLPDDQVNAIVAGVKAKISAGNIGNALGGLFGKK